jgi:hypothetical protein
MSRTPSPQTTGQSLSTRWFAPGGQQPSDFDGAVIWACTQTAAQVPAEISLSIEQASPLAQSAAVIGQAPGDPAGMAVSQVSPGSTTPSPQVAEQSGSVALVAFAGQQRSPATVAVISSQ